MSALGGKSRYVLIVRETSCDLFRVVGRKIVDVLLATGNAPSAEQVTLLNRAPAAPLAIIADFVADDYQRDRVLVRNPVDRRKLIARRVERVFPDLNLRGTKPLARNRQSGAGPGATYLLAGCASVPLLDAWLALIAAGRWRVSGVGILALELDRIAEKLSRAKSTASVTVLAVPRADRGLRLVARTADGFAATRVMGTQGGDTLDELMDRRALAAVGSWAQEYGGSSRGQPQVILVDPFGHSVSGGRPAGGVDMEVLGINDVAARLGLRAGTLEIGRLAESIVAASLGRFRGRTAIELRAGELADRYQARSHAQLALAGVAAALVLAVGLSSYATYLRNAQEQRERKAVQAAADLMPRLQDLRTQRADFRKDFAGRATGIAPDLALATLSLNAEVAVETAKLTPNLAAFAKAFDQKVFVSRLNAGAPPVVPKPSFGRPAPIVPPAPPKGPLPYSFIVHLADHAPPEQSLDVIGAVREKLRSLVPKYSIDVAGYIDEEPKPAPPPVPGAPAVRPQVEKAADAATPIREPSFRFTLTPSGGA